MIEAFYILWMIISAFYIGFNLGSKDFYVRRTQTMIAVWFAIFFLNGFLWSKS